MSIYSDIALENGLSSSMDTIDDGMHHFCTIHNFIEWTDMEAHYPKKRITTGRPIVALFIHYVHESLIC